MYNLNPLMRNTLITTNEVIFHAPTKHVLDPRLIDQSIIIAEERFIRPELGFDLYDALCEEKNKTVTADNKDGLLTSINNSIAELNSFYNSINQPQNLKPLAGLREGTVINAFEFLSAYNLKVWKQHLWKLVAECVVLITAPEAWVQLGSAGLMHTVAPMSPMGGSGDVSPDLRSVKWIMDQKQYRIDPLIQSMHNYFCRTKVTTPLAYPLYTRDCPCDNESKEMKRTDVILGLYDNNENNCNCDFTDRRTYY